MAMYSFGVGTIFTTPKTDAYGVVIANPSPIECGVLQDSSVDLSFDLKELYGRQQFAVDSARGKGKLNGKAKVARYNGQLINSMVFGQSMTTGVVQTQARSVTPVMIPSAPSTVLITPPNTGTFLNNLGVTDVYAVSLTRVASNPTTGQYAVDEATGTYTFATADIGKPVFINYRYSATVAGAKSGTVMNLDMGAVPTFELDLHTEYQGKILSLHLFSCTSSKFSFSGKQDDYNIPEFEFTARADALGRVFSWSISE
jgi:hypothetical protein